MTRISLEQVEVPGVVRQVAAVAHVEQALHFISGEGLVPEAHVVDVPDLREGHPSIAVPCSNPERYAARPDVARLAGF